MGCRGRLREAGNALRRAAGQAPQLPSSARLDPALQLPRGCFCPLGPCREPEVAAFRKWPGGVETGDPKCGDRPFPGRSARAYRDEPGPPRVSGP